MPLPRFDNAAMDGFAVRSADVADAEADAPITLRLAGPSSAGQATPPQLPAGCAQGAGMVHALAAANAWMIVPAEVDHLPAGALVEVWPM